MKKGIMIDRFMKYISEKQTPLSQVEIDILDLFSISTPGEVDRQSLVKRLSKLTLLSDGKTNPKTAKTLAGYEFNNYILHLTPSDLSGVNLCPSASDGCRASCLNQAGRGRFNSVQFARLRKTLYFTKLRSEFLTHLDREIGRIVDKSAVKVSIRLNGTSDIPWENIAIRENKSIFELYPSVLFYDYTKVFSRLKRELPTNYNLTFSASEENFKTCLQALGLGVNVAMVFDSLPSQYLKREVINGDLHDFRFLDAKSAHGLVIGLKAKGLAKRDTSGFVHRGDA